MDTLLKAGCEIRRYKYDQLCIRFSRSAVRLRSDTHDVTNKRQLDTNGQIQAKILIVVLLFNSHILSVLGRAILVDPPQRSSLWRHNYKTHVNVYDDRLNCGGYHNQWVTNQGKCGICGDPYQGPRLHESGQLYASGIVVRNYTRNVNGTRIPVSVNIDKNKLGYFHFQLCSDISAEDETCFQNNLDFVETESEFFYPGSLGGTFNLYVLVPGHINCSKCILRWQYTTGYRTEGDCLGCGNQETYYNCADIGILNREQSDGDSTNTGDTGSNRVIFGTATNTNNEVEVVEPDNGTVITLEGGVQVVDTGTATTTTSPHRYTIPEGMICYYPSTPSQESTTTTKPCTPSDPSLQCSGIGHYELIQGMGWWCRENCRNGNCNPKVCSCSCGSTPLSLSN